MEDSITAGDAAILLGISNRMIYELAAPSGPMLPHSQQDYFQESSVLAYMESCRCTHIERAKISSQDTPTIRVSSIGESALENTFRKLGITPKRTPPFFRKIDETKYGY
ncbi:hypothetical protein [Collimonas fungivorans]|uniref:hypothetical protein n=1 Tax=Collimonas fungivorans TaxID=158899 RepID=UPI00167F8D65|nr:hypothetical protein [Collimonas fungivorans]